MAGGLMTFDDLHLWQFFICDAQFPAASAVRSALTEHGATVTMTRDVRSDVREVDQADSAIVVLSDSLDDWPRTVGELHRVHRRLRIVLVTSLAHRSDLLTALGAGVVGIVRPDDPPSAVMGAIRGVCEQGVSLPRALTGELVEAIRNGNGHWVRSPHGMVRVTDREWQTLQLMVQGLPTRKIAAELFIAEGTVRSHVSALLGKLGVTSRGEAVSFVAARTGQWPTNF